MICGNCFKGKYKKYKISNPEFLGLFCQGCKKCGDIVFTHQQSLALDKRRKEIAMKKVTKKLLKLSSADFVKELEKHRDGPYARIIIASGMLER